MTQRLINTAKASWSAFDGWAAAQLAGGDPLALPLDRMLSLVYYWLTRDGEPDEVRKFDARLWVPPKGVAPAAGSPWSAEAETEAFRDFASAFKQAGGGAREGAEVMPS